MEDSDDELEAPGVSLELQRDDWDIDEDDDRSSVAEENFCGRFPIYEYETLADSMKHALENGVSFFVKSYNGFVNVLNGDFETSEEPSFEVLEDHWKLRLFVLFKFVVDLEIPYEISVDLEKHSVFNKSVMDCYKKEKIANFNNDFYRGLYKQVYVSLVTSLRNDKCPLKERLLNYEVSGREVRDFTYRQKWPAAWEGIGPGHLATITFTPKLLGDSLMQCNACLIKKRNPRRVYHWTLQTRSSDESETVYCLCLNGECNKRWKFSG